MRPRPLPHHSNDVVAGRCGHAAAAAAAAAAPTTNLASASTLNLTAFRVTGSDIDDGRLLFLSVTQLYVDAFIPLYKRMYRRCCSLDHISAAVEQGKDVALAACVDCVLLQLNFNTLYYNRCSYTMRNRKDSVMCVDCVLTLCAIDGESGVR